MKLFKFRLIYIYLWLKSELTDNNGYFYALYTIQFLEYYRKIDLTKTMNRSINGL